MSNSCLRCGYSWSARSKSPLRCPRCKSTRWDKEVIENHCLHCDTTWVQRNGKIPKYCPACHTSLWNNSKQTYTCPKCGRTRILRSNSRTNLCPKCDAYEDNHKPQNTHYDSGVAGISTMIRLWSNDDGLVLTGLDNGSGIATLYRNGALIGEINMEMWCRNHGLSYDLSQKKFNEQYMNVFAQAVDRIRFTDSIRKEMSAKVNPIQGMDPANSQIIILNEAGMTPLSISLKLNIPFTNVMDVLSNVPTTVR